MLLASECEQHTGLHVNIDHLVLEIDSDNRLPGKMGEVLVTDLSNYGMPFIRYKNGDIANYSNTPCPCGRGFPLLQSVEGRVLDAIKRPDGSLLPGEFFPHLLKDLSGLVQFQVVQHDLDILHINLVVDDSFSKDSLIEVESVIKNAMHAEIQIVFNYLEAIPKTEMGKTRVTISHVAL